MIKEYRFMPLSAVLKYVPEMQRLGVSQIARSRTGFLSAYKKAGSSQYLSDDWKRKRHGFIARHLATYKKGQNRRKLALIAWAYNPDKD